MLDFLYNLLIVPVELLVEIVYAIMDRLLGGQHCGVSIIAVSIIIQTIILPLYKSAERMQDEERQRQKEMSHWVNHIRKTFKGDERFMMLSTYYRQQDYRPWYVLKSSMALLLQVPFFIGAYHYLSELSDLAGKEFLFIKDLSLPDQAVSFGTVSVNILPILMTAINILSGMIYTHGFGKREKIQTYGLALIFLVLLYNSPSGLVLYWTMNNIYSLGKNICAKTLAGRNKVRRPQLVKLRKWIDKGYCDSKGRSLGIYFCEAVFLTAFMGGLIPLNVVNASPAEFIGYTFGPMKIVFQSITIYAGIFLVWGMIFAALMKPVVRYVFCVIMFFCSGVFILDYMFFGNHLGNMSVLLVYEETPVFSGKVKLFNMALIGVLGILLIWAALKHCAIMQKGMQVLALGTCAICIVNTVKLQNQINLISERNVRVAEDNQKILHLSKNGKNVVVFMLDRAIDGYVPFIFDEKPELKDAFEGFTYYPNTISYSGHTNMGCPALFGGYEYTPSEINKRADEKLADKHDEALLVMPKIFADEGYQVTVCDPPYAGSYDWTADLSIYDAYENMEAYITTGAYVGEAYLQFAPFCQEVKKYAFVYHSMMKVAPVFLQGSMYRSGSYMTKTRTGWTSILPKDFLDSYSTMTKLPDITSIEDSGQDNLLLFQNCVTHDVTLLKTPEYIPDETISGSYNGQAGYEAEDRTIDGHTLVIDNQMQAAHYQSNVAAFMALAEWFQYMKENDCWDNTRIIIVADHGYELHNFDYMLFENGLDVERFNPLLMMKDFNQSGYTVSDEFMTNADVPTMAMEGIIASPVNPFTGKDISSEAKYQQNLVTTSSNYDTTTNNGTVFDTSDGTWYEVTAGDIFDEGNWKKLE